MTRGLNLFVGFLAILFVASSIKGQEGTTEGFGPFEWPWEKFFGMNIWNTILRFNLSPFRYVAKYDG